MSAVSQSKLNIYKMVHDLSPDKEERLSQRLKDTLSARLGNALESRASYPSGATMVKDGKVTGVVLRSLKESFLSAPLFINDIRKRDWAGTYTLEGLQGIHQMCRRICATDPELDRLVQEALDKIADNYREYMLGFQVDVEESELRNELVFAIVEMRATKTLTRVQIPLSSL